jgi:hypothetical protein
MALTAATVAGFGLAATAALGWTPGTWMPGVLIGGAASIALLVLFFHPWLSLGIAIDLVLLWAVTSARWAPPGVVS